MAGSKAGRAVRLKISELQDQRGALFYRSFTCRTPWILVLQGTEIRVTCARVRARVCVYVCVWLCKRTHRGGLYDEESRTLIAHNA